MDLVGFSALTAERGDDEAAAVATGLFASVRRLLPRFGAEEIKTIGDAMMVRCGDPREGLELGLRISEEIAALDELPPLRIGVHTGPAVCRDGDWFGNAVNVAARLCSAAGGGEVLVSDATRRAAGSPPDVDFGSRRLHWLKNMPDPIVAGSAERREAPDLPAQRGSVGERVRLRVGGPIAAMRLRHGEVTG
jgi:adenylate cyclase